MPPKDPDRKAAQYARAYCDVCKGLITLRKDGTLRAHRQRDHYMYGVPNAIIPYCVASRSRMHSAIRRDQ